MLKLFGQWAFIALTSLAAMSANAGFIRYDMSYQPGQSAQVPSFEGYMTFNDMGPAPGNIWANIVDWKFTTEAYNSGPVTVESFVFDPSNTMAWESGYFEVDASGNYVSSGLFDSEFLFPCFSTDGLCEGPNGSEDAILSFQSFITGAIVGFPGSGLTNNPDFSGILDFSGPTVVPMPAPISGTLSLIMIGLAGLAGRGRPTHRIR